MILLNNREIEKLLTIKECMDILEELYIDMDKGNALFMPRVDNILPCNHDNAYYAFKHMGGAWPRYNVMALRINSDIVTHPLIEGRIRRAKVPLASGNRWVGLVQVYNTETGELEAIFPDGVAQRMRVGATNGLGVKHLARSDSRSAGIIGSGWQAGTQLLALLAARPIEEIKVYSLNRGHREAFAEEMRDVTAKDIRAVDSPDECVRDVDILLSATSSLQPVIRPEWLVHGIHVSCIKTQEVDRSVFERCETVVLHTKLQQKQFDHILPGTQNIPREHSEGWWKDKDLGPDAFPDLADIISDKVPGRTHEKEVTCFVNNIGLGLQFAALGSLVLEKAKATGVGIRLPTDWFTQDVHP